MMLCSPGDRVFAILSANETEVLLLGVGVYVEDRPAEALGGIPNPYLQLDNGHDVWGYECWWSAEHRLTKWLQGRTTVDASLPRWEEKPPMWYLAVCRECEPSLPQPFRDETARDSWAAMHEDATGHHVESREE